MTGCDWGVYRPEDQKPTKWRFGEWPRRDTPLCALLVEQIERNPDYYHPVMAFKDIECNTGTIIQNIILNTIWWQFIWWLYFKLFLAVKQSITIRNTTKISCQVKTKVRYHVYSILSDNINSEYTATWVFAIN